VKRPLGSVLADPLSWKGVSAGAQVTVAPANGRPCSSKTWPRMRPVPGEALAPRQETIIKKALRLAQLLIRITPHPGGRGCAPIPESQHFTQHLVTPLEKGVSIRSRRIPLREVIWETSYRLSFCAGQSAVG